MKKQKKNLDTFLQFHQFIQKDENKGDFFEFDNLAKYYGSVIEPLGELSKRIYTQIREE